MAAMPVMLAIEKKSDFQQSPPAGWRLNPATNKTMCEDGSVTVLTSDKMFEGRSQALEVGSLEELASLKQMIASKPILTIAKCTKDYHTGRRGSEAGEDYSPSTLTEEYIVLINTVHPQVASQFNKAYEQAELYLQQGKKFRITLNFAESLKIWFMNNVPVDQEIKKTNMAVGCDIYIVHGMGEPTCGDQCFSCETSVMKCFWGMEEHKITEAIPVTYHNGPFQMGFNLMGLFYQPGTTITTVTTYQQPYQQQPQPYTQQPPQYAQQPQQPYVQQQQPGHQMQPLLNNQQPYPQY